MEMTIEQAHAMLDLFVECDSRGGFVSEAAHAFMSAILGSESEVLWRLREGTYIKARRNHDRLGGESPYEGPSRDGETCLRAADMFAACAEALRRQYRECGEGAK